MVLFPETAELAVEWAALGGDPGKPGLVLVVPADSNTKAGTADVEVPEGSPLAPLTLRCGFGVWIGESRLGAARRTGDILDPQEVSAARRVWEARERGESVGSLLAEEVDADPEYQDWIEDVLIPARSALLSSPALAPIVPLRRRSGFFGNPLATAASVLLMVSLGLAGGLLWQDRRIEIIAKERARSQQELRQERKRLTEDLRRAADAHRRVLTETEQQAREASERDRERIAELEHLLQDARHPEALLNVPLVGLAPKDPIRGNIEEFTLPAKTGLFFLLLSVADTRPFPSYRLEVADQETGRVVWQGEGLKASHLNEVSLALQREVLTPGDYRLRLYGLRDGKAELVEEYEVRIVHQ